MATQRAESETYGARCVQAVGSDLLPRVPCI